MKRTVFLVLCLILFTLVASDSLAQQGSAIKVKNSAVVTGVVIVEILMNGTPYELQCNQGAASCQPLKSGAYWMVELPPNFGMYDCRNVEVYRFDNEIPSADRIGQYCLIKR